jgi:hypothetical protein
MNDSHTQDDGASLTQSVRRFRRAARLAAADPLRLLPPDPLTRLASLSAPIAALIDVAPLERLRETVGPPAAERRTHRTRLQRFIGGDTAVRPRPAAAALPSRGGAGSDADPATGGSKSTRPASHAPPALEPLHHEARPMATLAERRAALRREEAEPGSPSRPTPREAVQVPAGAGFGHARFDNRRDAPGLRHRVHEAVDQLPQHANLPFVPASIERGEASGPVDVSSVPDQLRRASHQPLATDQRQAASPRNAGMSPPAAAAPFARQPADDAFRTTGSDGHGDFSPAAGGRGASSHLVSASPESSQATPQGETSPARRRRGSDPSSELDPADALFETLYRDGVDLSWP